MDYTAFISCRQEDGDFHALLLEFHIRGQPLWLEASLNQANLTVVESASLPLALCCIMSPSACPSPALLTPIASLPCRRASWSNKKEAHADPNLSSGVRSSRRRPPVLSIPLPSRRHISLGRGRQDRGGGHSGAAEAAGCVAGGEKAVGLEGLRGR
jgi:hypothetical protein